MHILPILLHHPSCCLTHISPNELRTSSGTSCSEFACIFTLAALLLYDENKSIIFLLIVACIMYVCLNLQQVHFGILALHLLLKSRLRFQTQYMHAGVALKMSHDYYLHCLVTIIMCRIIVNNSEGAGTQTKVCTHDNSI